jgi:F-type H+-transporting ATPase subunit delta
MAETITIARPYAQAIFDLAREQGELSGWSEMLALGSAVVSNEEMAALIDNPNISKEQVIDLILDICDDALNETGKNMVRVLADNRRLKVLPEIAELFEIERATAEGTIKAEVISATSLTAEQQQSITSALKKRLGRDVTLECKTDESLVGGAVIRAGDLVIDGSVVGKLERLASELMH